MANRGALPTAQAAWVCALLLLLGGCVREKAEGRPWVHDLRLFGVSKKVSKRDLKKRLAIQETSVLPWAPRKYLDPFALPGDRERIEAYYHAHGYFSAKVTSAEIKPRKQHDSVDIEIHVEEGEATRISSVDLRGLERAGARSERLRKALPLVPGQIFVHERYLETRSLLRERLRLRGYAWPKVHGEADVDRDAHTALVRLEIEPGVVTHIGQITISGNQRVRTIDILRTADLHQGRRFDPAEIEEARGRLYNTGVFSTVRLHLERDPSDAAVAHVRIEVQEGPFRELRLGGGLSIESQRNDVHLFTELTQRNFLGGLRSLRVRLEPAFVFVPAVWNPVRYGPAAAGEVELHQPFVFGLRHLELRWVVGYDLGIDYAFQYHGPHTQIGLLQGLWRNRVQLGLSYAIQFLDFFNTDPAVLNDPMLSGTLYGYTDPYRVAWLQEEAALDLRDRPFGTHKGAFFKVTAEEGGVYTGSAFSYQKIVPDARFYAPLGARVTLAARFEYGQIWTQGELGSPITRRLYLGGPNSHRGFNYNRLSYQIPSGFDPSRGVPPLPIGGDQMLLMQGELRVRIVKLFGNYLGAVAFADGGDVTLPRCNGPCPASLAGALQSLDFTQLHWAVGGGLRYETVIGTIRFDLGVRLNRLQSTDTLPTPDPGQRIAYHISIGEAF